MLHTKREAACVQSCCFPNHFHSSVMSGKICKAVNLAVSSL